MMNEPVVLKYSGQTCFSSALQRILYGCVFLLLASYSNAQLDSISKKNTLLAYPVVFHLPETGWGIGAAGYYNFRFNKLDTISPPSQLQLGFAYTQNKQLLLYLPFNLSWNQRKHNLSGELGYNRYSYYFFGTGNDAPPDLKERYEVEFPRYRINYLRKLNRHWFGGARFWYENYNITEYEEGGTLESGNIPGGEGSVTSGPGLVVLFDSRDNIYQSWSGTYLELVYHNQSDLFGSTYWYDRYRFDLRHFFQTGERQSVAVQFFGDFLMGSVPFSQMAGMGSAKRMRGYYEGRYRDKTLLLLQTEYRAMVWKRWGIAAFANTGVVADEVQQLSTGNLKYAAGAGIRFAFDREKRVNIRLDYALGKNSSTLYFTVGEAF